GINIRKCRVDQSGQRLTATAAAVRRPVSHLRVLCCLAFMLFTLMGGAARSYAQTPSASPTPTPTEEELRLQEEKRLIELRKDIELAKKAIRDAQPQPTPTPEIPKPSATALEGNTTLDAGVKLETEMVSYKALSFAADSIGKEIKDKISKDIETRLAAHARQRNGKDGSMTDGDADGNPVNIAMYDSQIIKDWRFYQALFPAFEGQVKDIKQQYQDLLCPVTNTDTEQAFKDRYCDPRGMPRNFTGNTRAMSLVLPAAIPSAFAAGTTFLKSFIDLAALFRTDTKIEGRSVTIDESALVAEFFRALKNEYGPSNVNLYYPEVFPPRLDPSEGKSPTVTIIGELYIFKAEADRIIKAKNALKDKLSKSIKEPSEEKAKLEAELEHVKGLQEQITHLQSALEKEKNPFVRRNLKLEMARLRVELSKLRPQADLETGIETLKKTVEPVEARIKQITADVKLLTDLNERFLSFVNEFIKVDANGVNALALFIKSEDIENAMSDNQSYWLEVKSVSAGGNNRTRKNLLRYFSGARVDHSGGVIVEYTLYRKSGAVVYSDKFSYYEGYVEPKKIKDPKSFKDTVR
ncbi:MAG TPA: hypothetical protein VGO91_10280, partial [Pyrinomonadaceae bacterium]|nr:hypothetical protein [Pyrinomonadaceae bacterium]